MKLLLFITISLSSLFLRAQLFPEDWIGSYSGNMILGYVNQPADTIPIELEIKTLVEDSVWSHKMIYHSERFGEITKDYLIRIVSKGNRKNYLLDEQNGIIMPRSLMDNCFYGTYEVDGMLYMNTLRYLDGKLIFDLYCSPKESVSRNNIEEEGDLFVVDSYKVTLHQTAVLSRK